MKPPFARLTAAVALPLTLAACIPQGGGGDRYGYDRPPPPPPPPSGYYDNGAPRSDYDPASDYREEQGYDRAIGREDRVYRGRDGRYYCKRSNGATGLVVGGIGGTALGAILGGGGLIGILVGAAGGAILGREIDKGEVRCR